MTLKVNMYQFTLGTLISYAKLFKLISSYGLFGLISHSELFTLISRSGYTY